MILWRLRPVFSEARMSQFVLSINFFSKVLQFLVFSFETSVIFRFPFILFIGIHSFSFSLEFKNNISAISSEITCRVIIIGYGRQPRHRLSLVLLLAVKFTMEPFLLLYMRSLVKHWFFSVSSGIRKLGQFVLVNRVVLFPGYGYSRVYTNPPLWKQRADY